MHHMQQSRKSNINLIAKWVAEAKNQLKPGEAISIDSLERKAQLVIGCTKRKAVEYIKIIDEGLYL